MLQVVPTYNVVEIAKAIGIKRATLHCWLARRIIDGIETPGIGIERHFTFEQVMELAVIASLVRLGFTVSAAACIAKDGRISSEYASVTIRLGMIREHLKRVLGE